MGNIPKLIHYCWFGNHPKPENVKQNIAGWKNLMPDYRILEWNESNFDININPYVRQAYDAGMFAFVSDYARLYATYHHGGVYLDTDVEVLKPFGELLRNEVVFGFEVNQFVATSAFLARKHSVLIRDFMNSYEQRVFINSDESFDLTTNVKVLTDMLTSIGLIREDRPQRLTYKNREQVLILEQKYLSPLDYNTKLCHRDSTTYAIHHYHSSWSTPAFRLKTRLRQILVDLIGFENLTKVRAFLKKVI